MIPRGRPDISYSEIFKGLRLCAVDSQSRSTCMHELGNGTLACLSVRTGFDLVLAALNFAPGTEILVTDINIPDMFSIISAHGLTAVPVSVNKESLHLSLDRIRAVMTPLTRAILITHLFGARMDTDEVVALAKEMKWVVIEDCAQAFTGNTFRGNPLSDVVMFSFGLIKTHTTASGALLKINDAGLHAKVIELNEKLPRQTKRIFIKKLFKLGLMRFLTSRVPFTFFYKIVELAGYDPDHVLSSFTRGFQSKQMLEGIRHRPCLANLRFIEHRLRTFDPQMIEARKKKAQLVLEGIPAVMRIGAANFNHSHWVLPVETSKSDGLVRHLRKNGFDATKKASSLVRIGAPEGEDSDLTLDNLVYLPFCPSLNERECQQLRDLIVQFTVTKR